jgi:MoxR-like ATPase
MNAEICRLNKEAESHSRKLQAIMEEAGKVIVGQRDILGKVLISMVADGHVLLEGVPGLAKTMMIKTLSDTVSAGFTRIQFTPDLLPADITGTKIYNQKSCMFFTRKGPIFTNLVLADEVNRAPPKVQSALLEAMQERQVTIQGDTFPLEKPFLVLATQNPIETEGTYRLPEAQVDRFAMKLFIGYPAKDEELQIIDRMTGTKVPAAKKILTTAEVLEMQKFCRKVYADGKVTGTDIVDATRNPENYGVKAEGHIEYGASPRASLWLVLAAKAHAMLNGRGYVMPEDVKAVAHEVLRHRLILTYEAEAEEVTSDQIIDKILQNVRVP